MYVDSGSPNTIAFSYFLPLAFDNVWDWGSSLLLIEFWITQTQIQDYLVLVELLLQKISILIRFLV